MKMFNIKLPLARIIFIFLLGLALFWAPNVYAADDNCSDDFACKKDSDCRKRPGEENDFCSTWEICKSDSCGGCEGGTVKGSTCTRPPAPPPCKISWLYVSGVKQESCEPPSGANICSGYGTLREKRTCNAPDVITPNSPKCPYPVTLPPEPKLSLNGYTCINQNSLKQGDNIVKVNWQQPENPVPFPPANGLATWYLHSSPGNYWRKDLSAQEATNRESFLDNGLQAILDPNPPSNIFQIFPTTFDFYGIGAYVANACGISPAGTLTSIPECIPLGGYSTIKCVPEYRKDNNFAYTVEMKITDNDSNRTSALTIIISVDSKLEARLRPFLGDPKWRPDPSKPQTWVAYELLWTNQFQRSGDNVSKTLYLYSDKKSVDEADREIKVCGNDAGSNKCIPFSELIAHINRKPAIVGNNRDGTSTPFADNHKKTIWLNLEARDSQSPSTITKLCVNGKTGGECQIIELNADYCSTCQLCGASCGTGSTPSGVCASADSNFTCNTTSNSCRLASNSSDATCGINCGQPSLELRCENNSTCSNTIASVENTKFVFNLNFIPQYLRFIPGSSYKLKLGAGWGSTSFDSNEALKDGLRQAIGIEPYWIAKDGAGNIARPSKYVYMLNDSTSIYGLSHQQFEFYGDLKLKGAGGISAPNNIAQVASWLETNNVTEKFGITAEAYVPFANSPGTPAAAFFDNVISTGMYLNLPNDPNSLDGTICEPCTKTPICTTIQPIAPKIPQQEILIKQTTEGVFDQITLKWVQEDDPNTAQFRINVPNTSINVIKNKSQFSPTGSGTIEYSYTLTEQESEILAKYLLDRPGFDSKDNRLKFEVIAISGCATTPALQEIKATECRESTCNPCGGSNCLDPSLPPTRVTYQIKVSVFNLANPNECNTAPITTTKFARKDSSTNYKDLNTVPKDIIFDQDLEITGRPRKVENITNLPSGYSCAIKNNSCESRGTSVDGNSACANIASPNWNFHYKFYVTNSTAVSVSETQWWQVEGGRVFGSILDSVVPDNFQCEIGHLFCRPFLTRSFIGNPQSLMSGFALMSSIGNNLKEVKITDRDDGEKAISVGRASLLSNATSHSGKSEGSNNILNQYLGKIENPDSTLVGTFSSSNVPSPANSEIIYLRTGDLEIDLSADIEVKENKKVIILVKDGNVTITGDGKIKVDDDSLFMVIAGCNTSCTDKGNITFASSVGEDVSGYVNNPDGFKNSTKDAIVQGIYIAENTLTVESDSSNMDKRFIGEGNFVGLEAVDLQRSFASELNPLDPANTTELLKRYILSNISPTEIFRFNPNYARNLPTEFEASTLEYQER